MRHDEVERLRAENAQLQTENAQLRVAVGEAQALIEQLQARVGALETQKTRPPVVVRPTVTPPLGPPKPRRKRTAGQNKARRRETPTRVVPLALAQCPDCGYALRGGSVARVRQIIEVPPPPPVEITEYQLIRRHCPVCQRWHTPKAQWAGQVVGQSRLGVRLLSVLAYLRTTGRLPLRTVQAVVATQHGVRLSVGGIAAALTRMGTVVAPAVGALKEQARTSPSVHMDETGWREGGHNGYVWTLATAGPQGVRYYEHDRSRAGSVARRILGTYRGYLITDFYAAYHSLLSKHQYCWAHLARDLHALKEARPTDPHVVGWARAVQALFTTATTALAQTPALSATERTALAQRLDGRAQQLGRRYARVRGHPCRALAQRLLRHQGQLFAFVTVAGVDPTNNLAERTLRPLVIMRKISGGSRSPQGTTTRLRLASLFGTWHVRGLDPVAQCLALLSCSPS